MAGLTIREFTISTKVVNANKSEKTKTQSTPEDENTSQNESKHSYCQGKTNSMSIQEKDNLVRLCVDKVLEIMQHKLER